MKNILFVAGLLVTALAIPNPVPTRSHERLHFGRGLAGNSSSIVATGSGTDPVTAASPTGIQSTQAAKNNTIPTTTGSITKPTSKTNSSSSAITASSSQSSCDVFVSRTSATTICAATGSAVPSGFVKVPSGSGAPNWTQTPTGDCALGGSASVQAHCWQDLDLSEYVTWWFQNFNHTCDNLGFGDCFYAEMTKYAPSNCTQTGPNQPCQQPTFSDFQGNWNGARNFYVAWNIWNMGSFFSKYWIAVGDSAAIASGGVANITAVINPVKSTNVAFNTLMVALVTSLALLVPGAQALVPVESAVTAATLFGAVQSVPGIARFIIPEGSTEEQQYLDFTNVDASLSKMTNVYQNNIANALPPLLNNLTNFRTVAAPGGFSAQQPDTNDLKNQILPGLYTYITSQIYQAKGLTLLRTVDTDVHQLSSNGTNLSWDLGCGGGYNAQGACGEFYYSKQNKTTYALTDPNDDQNKFASAWTTVFNGYTSGDLLFAGADECAQSNKNNTAIHQPSIGNIADGPAAVQCLSSLPVCTWSTVFNSNGDNLSTDCAYGNNGDPLGRWVGNTGGDVAVPVQYLGYGVISDKQLSDSKLYFDKQPCGETGNCD